MRKKGEKDSFWPSYVDIVTTLFAIMVVLFAVSYSRFRVKEAELRKIADKYEEIKSIYKVVENIDSTFFAFNPELVKFIFKIQVTFQTGEFELTKLDADLFNKAQADSLRENVRKAGLEIQETISKLVKDTTITKQDIKYLVVIEGQASADGYGRRNGKYDKYFNNDVLSYQRAFYLNQFWKDNGIDFSSMEKCELVISGSGEKGIPRDTTDEKLNQRFLIHIVPVIGNIRLDDSQKSVVNR